jgi:hypothetical protein
MAIAGQRTERISKGAARARPERWPECEDRLSLRRGQRRRALELLASSRDGCSEAIMIAHGFSIDMIVGLVRAGLATATAERVVGGACTFEITWL